MTEATWKKEMEDEGRKRWGAGKGHEKSENVVSFPHPQQ